MEIGFSTGSISRGDYKSALAILNSFKNVATIELSALREEELENLINDLPNLELSKYKYVSFHAPSKFVKFSEKKIVELLEIVTEYKYPIIVHPDIIINFDIWKSFDKLLCIENMDKRKPTGRTVKELDIIFNKLPNASFCFDIAHARQIDSSMFEAINILKNFKEKLSQIHISEVNSESKHETISFGAILAYQQVAEFIPDNIPIIIESLVSKSEIENELIRVETALDKNYKNFQKTIAS